MVRRLSRIVGLAGLLAVPGLAVGASPATPPLPGGTLDTRHTGAEVYLTRPERAKPPADSACALAEAYVNAINAGRYRDAADLFAEDGILFEPMRHTYRGRTEIRTFYEGTIGPMRPEVVPVTFLGNDRDCMVELAARTQIGGEQRYALVSVNHFTIDASGKAARMIAFVRPPRSQ